MIFRVLLVYGWIVVFFIGLENREEVYFREKRRYFVLDMVYFRGYLLFKVINFYGSF